MHENTGPPFSTTSDPWNVAAQAVDRVLAFADRGEPDESMSVFRLQLDTLTRSLSLDDAEEFRDRFLRETTLFLPQPALDAVRSDLGMSTAIASRGTRSFRAEAVERARSSQLLFVADSSADATARAQEVFGNVYLNQASGEVIVPRFGSRVLYRGRGRNGVVVEGNVPVVQFAILQMSADQSRAHALRTALVGRTSPPPPPASRELPGQLLRRIADMELVGSLVNGDFEELTEVAFAEDGHVYAVDGIMRDEALIVRSVALSDNLLRVGEQWYATSDVAEKKGKPCVTVAPLDARRDPNTGFLVLDRRRTPQGYRSTLFEPLEEFVVAAQRTHRVATTVDGIDVDRIVVDDRPTSSGRPSLQLVSVDVSNKHRGFEMSFDETELETRRSWLVSQPAGTRLGYGPLTRMIALAQKQSADVPRPPTRAELARIRAMQSAAPREPERTVVPQPPTDDPDIPTAIESSAPQDIPRPTGEFRVTRAPRDAAIALDRVGHRDRRRRHLVDADRNGMIPGDDHTSSEPAGRHVDAADIPSDFETSRRRGTIDDLPFDGIS